MPIKIPNELPAFKTLTNENVFLMSEARASTQDIRPLRIAILNLMPNKIETETQLLRLLGNTSLQVEIELLHTKTHKSKNVSADHLLSFYKTLGDVRNQSFDGMIITGAPVEKMDFEEVEYWEELCEIMEWSKTHVHSTFHICWGAQAGLYYHHKINKVMLDSKLFGVFPHILENRSSLLFRGFDDVFMVPHSRHSTINAEDVKNCAQLEILSSSPDTGIFAVSSQGGRQLYIMGHSEYDANTLEKEYLRDKNAGLDIAIPKNYYPGDDITKSPMVTWRSCAHMMFSNWLNYYVYQTTPYNIGDIH